MKPTHLLSALCAAALLCGSASADNEAPPKKEFKTTGAAMGFGLQRGFVNLLTFWLELPRNLSYEMTAQPLSSLIIGPLLGVSYSALRAADGLIDVVTLGYNGNYAYAADIPDYVWQSPWVSSTTDLE